MHITRLLYTQICFISKDFVFEEMLLLVDNYQHSINNNYFKCYF